MMSIPEDVRVATRLSELAHQILDKREVRYQSENIENTRLDLANGQQCVRDFFICLNNNLEQWPDVYSQFSFSLTHSTICSTCGAETKSDTSQIYLEMPVPPDGSDLNMYIEEMLNEGSSVLCNCSDGCNSFSQKMKRTTLHNSDHYPYAGNTNSRWL